jgi:hypothetical protein
LYQFGAAKGARVSFLPILSSHLLSDNSVRTGLLHLESRFHFLHRMSPRSYHTQSERAIVCEDREEVEDSWEPPSIGKEASESVLACEAAD